MPTNQSARERASAAAYSGSVSLDGFNALSSSLVAERKPGLLSTFDLASAVVDSSMNRAAVLGGGSDDRQAIGSQLKAV